MNPPQTIPAATLILFRETAHGPELLMIERHHGMAFAAGALVFPGGRVDPGDVALAALHPGHADPFGMAAMIAAIRETIEEVDIAVGLLPTPDSATVRRVRAGLMDGKDFAGLLGVEKLRLDPAALTPFARWRPDTHQTRNFDTVFFIAEAPPGAVASADGGESVRALWATATDLLADADAGRHRLIFPTRRNLERLVLLPSIAAARAHAADHPVTIVTPWVEERGGEPWLCIPEGIGYPVTAEPVATARRG